MCSMISSQCDERLDERLRRAAQTCRELGKHTTANMFLESADTILELRDDLQRANEAVQDAEHDESMAWDRVRKVEVENAKLRELVRDMRKAFFTLDIDHCQECPRDTINGPCTKYLISGSDECNFEEEMRELRIEVE